MKGALVLLFAVAVIWCGQAIGKAGRSTGNDLVGYLDASRALYAGEDPYHLPDRFPYVYPLFLAVIVRPLASLGVRSASVTWFALQWACLWYVLRETRIGFGVRTAGLAVSTAIVVAVFGDVLQIEFVNGQVNLIVIALAVAAARMDERNQRLAAALLGAAIALKLTPALLLLYWIVRRRYRFAAEAIAWGTLFVLTPWLIVRERLWTLYGSYLDEFILPRTASAGPHGRDISFSVYGFLQSMTGGALGPVAILVIALVTVGALVFWHRRLLSRREGNLVSAAAVYIASMPLLSPMSEVHHLTALLPVASYAASSASRGARKQSVVIAALGAFTVLLWIARFDRRGPWYFLALVSVLAAGGIALQRDSSEN